MFQQQDSLLLINYVCTTERYPGTLYNLSYDNGTHSIDFVTCVWFKNADPQDSSREYIGLNAMYCSEMLARHDSGELYLSSGNLRLAESKAAACAHVFGGP